MECDNHARKVDVGLLFVVLQDSKKNGCGWHHGAFNRISYEVALYHLKCPVSLYPKSRTYICHCRYMNSNVIMHRRAYRSWHILTIRIVRLFSQPGPWVARDRHLQSDRYFFNAGQNKGGFCRRQLGVDPRP